jgi:hypothetical protein
MATNVVLRMSGALGMRRDGAAAEIGKPAIAAERIGWGLIHNLRWNIVSVRCVLIKLSLRLLHRRKTVDGTLAALDMSQQRLMWFVSASA